MQIYKQCTIKNGGRFSGLRICCLGSWQLGVPLVFLRLWLEGSSLFSVLLEILACIYTPLWFYVNVVQWFTISEPSAWLLMIGSFVEVCLSSSSSPLYARRRDDHSKFPLCFGWRSDFIHHCISGWYSVRALVDAIR